MITTDILLDVIGASNLHVTVPLIPTACAPPLPTFVLNKHVIASPISLYRATSSVGTTFVLSGEMLKIKFAALPTEVRYA
jgi:hypothetical protein